VRATYGGLILDSHDPWCGPTDLCLAPDGSIYISDFYDQRTAHPDPDANWDRSNGRIYKVAAAADGPADVADVAKLPSDQLVSLLTHRNYWYAYRARAELARRRDASLVKPLRDMATQTADRQRALEALWALNLTAGVEDELTLELLDHPYPYVRYWAIRLAGDRKDVSAEVGKRLAALAGQEQDPAVRGQLAATAKRLPGTAALPIVEALLRAAPEDDDPRVPWLIWWAIESKALTDAPQLVTMFSTDEMWDNPAARQNILRLIRRYAAEGSFAAYHQCLALLQSAPARELPAAHEHLRLGLAERAVGLQGIGQGGLFGQHAGAAGEPTAEARHYEPLPDDLKQYISRLWREQPHDVTRIELSLRADLDGARPALKGLAFGSDVAAPQRVALLALLREFRTPDAARELLKLIGDEQPEAVQIAALEALAGDDSSDIAENLLARYEAMAPAVRARARDVLFARPQSALAFLKRVEQGAIAAEDAPLDQVGRLAAHHDEAIDELVRKHWGRVGPGSPEELLATMRRYNNDLRPGGGDMARGKLLFTKHCAVCHQLHGEGNKIGPDLTTANRQDREALLANIVDPSAVIRREYMNYVVLTDSGLVVSGLLADQDAASVTILDAKNQRIKVPRNEIESLEESEVSLMPERILETLTPQEIRDLFAYVQESPAK
jgi:putative heme-binding domain-containing protein